MSRPQAGNAYAGILPPLDLGAREVTAAPLPGPLAAVAPYLDHYGYGAGPGPGRRRPLGRAPARSPASRPHAL